MHALPSHPKHPLVAAMVALLAALAIMAATAPDLGSVNLSLGGGAPSEASVEHAVPASPHPGTSSKPVWVSDPLSPPTLTLAGRR
jgi:hypothetical protein